LIFFSQVKVPEKIGIIKRRIVFHSNTHIGMYPVDIFTVKAMDGMSSKTMLPHNHKRIGGIYVAS
jgi:hypothetical protein